MQNRKSPLEAECTYHIYNRANGAEMLFLSEENYEYFLTKFKAYILPIADVFAYCLMPNHFHFLLRLKSKVALNFEIQKRHRSLARKFRGSKKLQEEDVNLQGFEDLEGFITQQFSNFFNAYSKAFNKQYGRKGSLFMHTFKRVKVTDKKHLIKLVHYIHYNPIEAGLTAKPEEWKYSSFNALISNKPSLLQRREVISRFHDLNNFIYCHQQKPSNTGIE